MRDARWLGGVLWLVAVIGMLSAAVWQRTTGPTYPFRGTATVGAVEMDYALTRSGTSTEDEWVELPNPDGTVEAVLVYRRYPTSDPYRSVPFEATDSGTLAAPLPRQPAAGKLEYYVEVSAGGASIRVPTSSEMDPVIRFKDPVPVAALVPHVLAMFFAMLIGFRAGLSAAVGRAEARRYAWVAFGLMTIGGMILGPIVQKHAFGAYWTGFPFGYDLTDNKTLIMWLVWVTACVVLVRERRSRAGSGSPRPGRPGKAARGAIMVATAVMLVVYLVPHSLRGSELDYEQLEEGADPMDAIRTG